MKTVHWYDDDGFTRKSLLPIGAPDEDAPYGIPIGLQLSGLYPEPFATQIEEAIMARGILGVEDIDIPGAATLIRQAIQQVLKIEVNRIRQHIKGK